MKKFFTILFLLPLVAAAQFKTVSIGNGSNPSIAIDKKNPLNIVVASSEGISYSLDGGQQWKTGSAQYIGSEHFLLAARKGGMYDFVVSLNPDTKQYDKIVGRLSEDGGNAWQEIGSLSVPGKDIRYPRVCMTGKSGDILITWTQYDKYGSDGAECKSAIMLSRSKDGKKLGAPVQINQVPGDCKDGDMTPQGAMPAANVQDMMFVTWTMNKQLEIDRSFDKGDTWLTNDIRITDQAGGSTLTVPGLGKLTALPSLVVDNSPGKYNGSLFLMWSDQRKPHDTDIWMMRSVNFGDNWTTPVRISDDEAGKHQFAPSVVLDQSDGMVYVVYYDRRDHDDEMTDVYLAYSSDNGNSFKNVKISENAFTVPGTAVLTYTDITASNGTIIPVWMTSQDGNATLSATVIKKADLVKKAP